MTPKKGRLTIPTDATFVEGTKKLMDYWGADAIRDCDGVSLPADVKQFHSEVYKAYFIVREDHEYAKAHPEYWQSLALSSKVVTAKETSLSIDLMEGRFKESLAPNAERLREFWQVWDRTAGALHPDWEYDGKGVMLLKNVTPYHAYSVNFFARNCWDPVQIYNYHVNGWTVEKDIDLDPVYPEALHHMLSRMEMWLKQNPDVTTVRFTTFFYNFFIVYETGLQQRLWDWHDYAMTASPAMFDLFKKETGVTMTLEDVVRGGTYSNRFVIPTERMRRYVDFVQRKCSHWAKAFVDLCHKYGKKAMMFDGDHHIGTEPYSPYFETIGLDAVVGAPSSSVYLQQVANMKGVTFTEGRLNPYFFPNECPGDEKGTKILKETWGSIRRGLLRKPIDRIGFGGYLRQAAGYPHLVEEIKKVADEFRLIYERAGREGCVTKLKAAVISYWGKMDTWMQNGVMVDDFTQEGYFYSSLLSALSVLPIEVDFLSFEDAKKKDLSSYDAIVSSGIPQTSFQGGECWADPDLVSALRKYVDNGGGWIGVGEPSGYWHEGRYFQLYDVMGVEKECGFTHLEKRDPIVVTPAHWISEGLDLDSIRFTPYARDVYPWGATVLRAHFDPEYPEGSLNAGHVDFATNSYGKGRSVYLSGFAPSSRAEQLLWKALLWVSHKERELQTSYCDNPDVNAYYYGKGRGYALINLTDKAQKTRFFDAEGKPHDLSLSPNEIKWLDE